MDEKKLDILKNADWKKLFKQLVKYAQCIINSFENWSTRSKTFLPEAMSAEDIAFEAITDVWEGRRSWDMEKCPVLLKVLKAAIKSKVRNLYKSKDQRKRLYLQETETNKDICTKHPDKTKVSSGNPLEEVIEKERILKENKFLDRLCDAISEDEELEQTFYLIDEGKEPREIAKIMKLPIQKVYQNRKKLIRIGKKIKD